MPKANMLRLSSVLFAALVLIVSPEFARAQKLVLTDETSVELKAWKRQGSSLVIPVSLPNGGSGEAGYMIQRIARIEMPKPSEIGEAEALLMQGKPLDAAVRLKTALDLHKPLWDIPGAWWADLAVLRIVALDAAGNRSQAYELAKELRQLPGLPSERGTVFVLALGPDQKSPEKVRTALQDLLEKLKDDSARAEAWLRLGDVNLKLGDAESALLAYLQLPVFYLSQQLRVPAAILGASRAYALNGDQERARRSLQTLLQTYPQSAEARAAEAELTKLNKPQT